MPSRHELRLSLALFFASLCTMFWSWGGTESFLDSGVAWEALLYTVALAVVILSHEFAHYFVAVRHGWKLSLPYFLPNPFAFGSFGAVIVLRGEPPNRTALLEMGAAGPIMGALVSFALLAVGLPWTGPDVLPVAGETCTVLHDPLMMDVLGKLVAGGAPGRYAELHPLALAGWVGCLITAINLIPLGQTDGGHIVAALAPSHARRISRVMIGLLVLGGLVWPGWAVWAGIALILGFWRNLDVPGVPPLTGRARAMAMVALVVWTMTFMPRPVEQEVCLLPEASATRDPGVEE